jgi:hypothetical protein
MAPTRSAYWRAISEKISDAPHDPCIFSTVVWARAICGAAMTAPAPAVVAAAPFRNFRRVDSDASCPSVLIVVFSLIVDLPLGRWNSTFGR